MAYNIIKDEALTEILKKSKQGLAEKVDKVTGKGLSTNDYSDAEKKKLADTATKVENLESGQGNYLPLAGGTMSPNSQIKISDNTYIDFSKTGDKDNGTINFVALGGTDSAIKFNDGFKANSAIIASTEFKDSKVTINTVLGVSGEIDKVSSTGEKKAALMMHDNGYLVYLGADSAPGNIKAANPQESDDLTTKKYVDDIKNDIAGAGYQTSEQVSAAITTALKDQESKRYKKVASFDALPTTGEDGVIYLVPHTHGDNDAYDEYFWNSTDKKYEKYGNTDINLDGYTQDSDFTEVDAAKIDSLWDSITV